VRGNASTNAHVQTPGGRAAPAAPAPPPPRSVRLASRGLPTVRQTIKFSQAVACDAMTGSVELKAASVAIRSLLVSARFLDVGLRHGDLDAVLDDGIDECVAPMVDPLALRERELEEELAAVRKERAAQ
jgi:hypothetical protein